MVVPLFEMHFIWERGQEGIKNSLHRKFFFHSSVGLPLFL